MILRARCFGRQAAQVGQALFGHHDHGVVLGVVDMAGHRHDAEIVPPLAVLGDMNTDR